ncbi:hypothetical protein K501DRAFT_286290 [Backusella circina FSU 941]|nr:hypothetical protein K501DRAFT_286290 [Backusella circina FSU 941]
MSASWPPDFKNYENLSNDEVVKAIISESQNKLAPSNYTHFFQQIANILDSQKEQLRKQKALNDSNAHCMETVETHFHSLTTLYSEEYDRRLDMEKRYIDERMQSAAAMQQLQDELAQKLDLEKQDFTKLKEKQAIMRMKMEQELVKNMRETEELKQKLREAEIKTAALEKAITDRNQYQLAQQDKNVQMAGANAATGVNNSNMEVDFFMRYFGTNNHQ